jgi:chromosome segregation protein
VANLANLPVDDLQTEAAHWAMQAMIAEKVLEEAQRRMRELDQTLTVVKETIVELERQIAEIQQSRLKLEREKKDFLEEESEVSSQLEDLKNQIDPAEMQLEQFETEQVALQTREARARQTLNQAEHQHAQAKIALARKQESLDALRRRIEDDFGLVAFDYADDVTGPTPLPLEGMVEQLPRVTQISPEVEETIKRQKAILRRMGPINPEAQNEYREVKERFEFLTTQVSDLHKAEDDVRQVIAELDALMQREFQLTFKLVAEEFRQIFSRLFGGGSARLVLTDPDDLTHTGIDIEARLPGRREQGLSLLSGGERSLTAVSLVFAILRVSPTPFCVLDEVDAMLDEANVGRFRELLKELSLVTQFVIITHNRNTVQVADVLYGVTMGRDSTTQTLSLRMDEIDRVID